MGLAWILKVFWHLQDRTRVSFEIGRGNATCFFFSPSPSLGIAKCLFLRRRNTSGLLRRRRFCLSSGKFTLTLTLCTGTLALTLYLRQPLRKPLTRRIPPPPGHRCFCRATAFLQRPNPNPNPNTNPYPYPNPNSNSNPDLHSFPPETPLHGVRGREGFYKARIIRVHVSTCSTLWRALYERRI